MNIRFDQPAVLWWLLLAGPVVWLGLRSLATLDPVRRWTAIALRLAVLVVLVCMLAGLQTYQRHSDLAAIAVLDTSESIRRFARPPMTNAASRDPDRTVEQWLLEFVRQASSRKRPDDRLGLVTYDGRPVVQSLPTTAAQAEIASVIEPMDGTDSATALRLAMALFPADSGKRLLWASDGNDTALGSMSLSAWGGSGGDVLAAAREAAAAGIPIDVLPIPYSLENEVMVEGVYAPTEAREQQRVAVRVVLRATRPSPGTLYLRHDGRNVTLSGPDFPGDGAPVHQENWSLEEPFEDLPGGSGRPDAAQGEAMDHGAPSLGRYVLVRSIELQLADAGINRFEAVFEAERGYDTIAANNRSEGFTLVQGPGRVLVLDNVGGDSGGILPRTLEHRGVRVDRLPGTALPTSMTALQRYDAVILQNVPAEMMTQAQQRMLARYVHDLGGGLVMVGGPDSFGAGGWTNSPIDEILPVECQIPSQTILPSGALVIVLDRSGSMAMSVSGTNLNQQQVANEAAIISVSTLYPDDLIGVVAFDHSSHIIVPLQENRTPGNTAKLIRSIQPSGGTNIYIGLEEAVNMLAPLTPDQAAVKHIILLSDGESMHGDWVGIARRMAQADISLTSVGIGDAQNSQLLNNLASMVGGMFYSVADPNQLPQVFIKEARSIRKSLIKEGDFAPQSTGSFSPILAGITATPPLRGLVLTGPKRRTGVIMPLVGAEGEPLFAHWQVGLGRSAAFTSDATNRWATPWLDWPGYADFWTRMIRNIARPTVSRDYDLVSAVEGDTLRIRLDATGHEDSRTGRGGGFANFLSVRGAVLGPDGKTESVTLTQTGPGVYEAQMPARAAGNYIVSLFADGGRGEERQAVFGGVNKPPSAELRNFRTNHALLEEVARITGGRVLDPTAPQPANLFTREMPFESRSVRPLWRPLLITLIVLLLLDVACRRIAWDVMSILAWCRAKLAGIAAAMQGRQVEAGRTLDALKARAARFDAEQAAAAPGNGDAIAPTSASASSASASARPAATTAAHRKRKFEADGQVEVVEDLAAAVGGASRQEASRQLAAAARGPEQATAEQGPVTSRLLDVKRRAREKLQSDDA